MIEIHNADCVDFMAYMPDKSVDVVFTSPPYNRKRNDKYAYYNDNVHDYFCFLEKVIGEFLRIAKYNVFVNIQPNYYNRGDVYALIGAFSDRISNIFTWIKTNPTPSKHHVIINQYEWIIAFGELNPKDKVVYNVIQTNVARMDKNHKAVMHQDVADFFIRNFTRDGYTVYDPFFGLGTTAISCQKYGVNCIGTEISTKYCALARERILQNINQAQLRLF